MDKVKGVIGYIQRMVGECKLRFEEADSLAGIITSAGMNPRFSVEDPLRPAERVRREAKEKSESVEHVTSLVWLAGRDRLLEVH